MAKKAKETAATKKAPAPVDPVKSKNLIRLLNILALILAITAFLLQLFAVLTHHWKWQVTDISQFVSPSVHYSQPHIYNDSRLDQQYGLYSREVKLYANNDEQLDLWASTRFPRLDDGETSLHHCLSQTPSLRGAFLTCSARVVSPEQCHCRRHAYWNWVIFFEIVALILLGIVVLLTALLTTEYQAPLKLAGAGLAILAFLFLFIGLILILSHLKRETRSLSDAYPHIHQRLANKLGITHGPQNNIRTKETILHQAVRRQTHETYRAYPLAANQLAHNETHYQEYSYQIPGWVFKPYSGLSVEPVAYQPLAQRGRQSYTSAPRRHTNPPLEHSEYGPALGYDSVFDYTRAGIELTAAKKTPTPESVPLKQDVSTVVTTETRTIPADYDSHRPIGDAVAKTHHVNIPAPTPTRTIPTDYDHNRPAGDAFVKTHHVTTTESHPARPSPTDGDHRHPGDTSASSHVVRHGPHETDHRQETYDLRNVVIPDEHPATHNA